MRRLFGTDGVRGLANLHPITSEVALQLGRAASFVFKNNHKNHRIVIGKDTRLSGYMLESALVSGITSMGADAILIGPVPTPGIAFITQSMRADAGIVLSASHNEFQDNGIKFFDRYGYKLPDEVELKMEQLIEDGTLDQHRPTAEGLGRAYRVDDAKGRYIEFLKGTFPRHLTLEGLKLVVDCAHGASYQIAPTVFEELGAEVISIGIQPNGLNINRGWGALHPEKIAQKVKETGADLGCAFDGDADRVVFCDEFGETVEGDHIMALTADHLSRIGALKNKTVVSTIMANKGLELFLEGLGIQLIRTQVGDRYVTEAMREKGYNYGGEPSGHYIFLDYNTTGDGIVGALQMLSIMCETGKKLSELKKRCEMFPQVSTSVVVKQQRPIEEIPELVRSIHNAEKSLGPRGRLVVRYSGTEPVLRIMLESADMNLINRLSEDLKSVVERTLT